MDKLLLILSAVAGCFIVAMMLATTPSGVGPVGVLAFFALTYVLFLGLAVVICRLFFTLRAKLNKAHATNIKKKSYYYGLAVALAPEMLLACGSMGGITPLEVVLVFALEAVICFLVSRNIL